MPYSVETPGWHTWERELGILPAHWRDAEKIFLRVSARWLVVHAKDMASKYEADNRVYHRAVRDLKAAGNGTVRYGGQPWDMGAEFGSYQYHQFNTWRGNGEEAGYFLWPAVRMYRDHEMVHQYFAEVWHTVKVAFPGYS